jgi:hypothetical protein
MPAVNQGYQNQGSQDYPSQVGNSGDRVIQNQPQPSQVITTKDQVFRVKCWGMKPNTLHNFIFEGENKNSLCSIISNHALNISPWIGLGSPLITNEKGEIEFDFYFKKAATIYGNGRLSDRSSSGKGERYDGLDLLKEFSLSVTSSGSSKKFELKAENSYATKTIPTQ